MAVAIVAFLILGPSARATAQPAAVGSAATESSGSASEGGAASGGSELSRETLEELLATLEDDQARARLVDQLRALAAVHDEAQAKVAKPGLAALVVDAVSTAIAGMTAGLGSVANELARPQAILNWLRQQAAEPELRGFWIRVGIVGLVAIGAGLLAAGLATWLLGRPRRALEARGIEGGRWRRAPPLLLRTLIDFVPLVAFCAAVIVALILVDPEPSLRRVILVGVEAVVAARGVAVLTRAVFAPLAPGLRLIPVVDDSAAYAYVWVTRLASWAIYGAALVQIAREVGASAAAVAALSHVVALAFVVLGFVLLLQSRERVANLIRGSAEAPASPAARLWRAARRVLADTWHLLAGVYLIVGFSIWVLDLPGGFVFLLQGTIGSVIALLLGLLMTRAAGQGVNRIFRVGEPLRQRYPDLERRASRYQPFARGIANTVVWLVTLLVALAAWSVETLPLLAHETTRLLLTGIARIGLVLLLGLGAWEGAQIVIERLLGENGGDGGQSAQSRTAQRARARTLLPLARSALMIVIVACVSMSVLAEIGVNIGPLIAGAGILGLAVGFGAQTLVKDVITGVFILLEDAIAVGDLVEVAGHTGVVEAINIRSIRHRDLSGVLHTVPFSVVDVVRNLSKDFSYYLTDVGVAYRENTDECVEIMREVLEEMRADPEWGWRILEPLEFMGIQGFGDSAVMIRVRIKTRPIEQFPTGREFNRRLKHAFDARGIEIPFPHQTLYFGVDKEGRAPAGRLRIESGAPDPPDAPSAPSESRGSGGSNESHGRESAQSSLADPPPRRSATGPKDAPPSDREALPPRVGSSPDDG